MTVQADTRTGETGDELLKERACQGKENDKVPSKATCQENARQNGSKYLKKKGKKYMSNQTFMSVADVAKELGVSKSYAYRIVRELNEELRSRGYLIVTGRVNTNYFRKKVCYGEQNN
jgi:ribosomal protein S25